MFPISIFDAVCHANFADCEDFLFSKCVVDELLCLMKGITIETVGEDGSFKKNFVQARVILHAYDTKAFEKMMRVMPVASAYEWCGLCMNRREN